MKLRKREVEIISQNITKSLIDNGYVVADNAEDLAANIVHVIHEDLMVEDKLNDEVRQILEEHSSEFTKSNLEYHSAFKLVKNKLVRERNLIL